MFPVWAVWLGGLLLALVAGFFWKRWRAAQLRARWQYELLQLLDNPAALAEQFRTAAAATGKPRGLRWKECELHQDVVFADDRATGELYALIGATISFEAIEGGGMEEVEAVSNLRYATAVFVHRGGTWTSDGRTVFNHSPQQALQRYEESLQPTPAPGETAPAPGTRTAGDR